MTHFIGAVMVPAEIAVKVTTKHIDRFGGYDQQSVNTELQDYLDGALARFDENTEVEPRLDADEDAEANLDRARNYYTERGMRLLPGLLPGATTADKLTFLNEEWTADDTWCEEGGKLVRYTTYNPDSKWDWYQVGGRWNEVYADRQGESLALLTGRIFNDPDARPYSIVTLGGEVPEEWVTKGEHGWFGMREDKVADEDWAKKFDKLIRMYPADTQVVYIDFHI